LLAFNSTLLNLMKRIACALVLGVFSTLASAALTVNGLPAKTFVWKGQRVYMLPVVPAASLVHTVGADRKLSHF
jgi:hypothetical protein